MKKMVWFVPVIFLLASCTALQTTEITPLDGESELLTNLPGSELEQTELDSAEQHSVVNPKPTELQDAAYPKTEIDESINNPASQVNVEKELLSAEELEDITNYLEDYYADIYKEVSARDLLGLDIIKKEQVNDFVHIKYDFYEMGEGFSLRIATAIIGKNHDGQPYIVSDEIDEAAMERVEKEIQVWAGISDNPLVGYWADIYQADDGIDHLNGFYFAEDGTGLIFHSAEGAFPITSYTYSDNVLSIFFLNMADEPAEWVFNVYSLSENKLETMSAANDDKAAITYSRMLNIEPYNCLGGYTVTKMDGLVVDIEGYY